MNLPVPTDSPRSLATPTVELEPLPAAVPTEWPAAGGRYLRDPATGIVIPQPDEAPATPAPEGP